MRTIIRQSALLLISLTSFLSFSQNDSIKKEISSRFTEYFRLYREAIHVQLDKDVFLSDEQIWFKGYVMNRKTATPFLLTTNVFAVLTDSQGNKVDEQLVFASGGAFSGNISLGKKYASGTYFLQFFTNWMNNFSEDESSVYKVTVVNTEKPLLPSDKPDYSKVNIEFNPQGGGNLILGVRNVVGISVTDCTGAPLVLTDGYLADGNGKEIMKISLNKFGYGKFDFTPESAITKAFFTLNGQQVSATLPPAQQQGITLDVNSYAAPDKTYVTIGANPGYVNSLPGKKLFLSVNQDEKAVVFDIDFNNGLLEQKLIFMNDNLSDGVNTVTVFDADKNMLAQRLVFKKPADTPAANLTPSGKLNQFTGSSPYPHANLSISVLPENTLADKGHSDLYASLLINPYLAQKITNAHYYLDQPSKTRLYELDLLLLNQRKLKYSWSAIAAGPPARTYEFDYGLTVKGTLNHKQGNIDKYMMKLFSLFSGIREMATIDSNNEFYFKNLVAPDGAQGSVSFVKPPELSNPLPAKMAVKVINASRSFKFPYRPGAACVPKLDSIDLIFPDFNEKDVIRLDEVKVDNKYKLTRQMGYGNALLKGYKITAENNGLDVLNFIRNHGFDVVRNLNNVAIYGRSRTTINGQRNEPVVYLDNFRMMDFGELDGMRMDDIDEIYISSTAIVSSVNNNIGVIKIYRKKVGQYPGKEPKTNIVDFKIDGYQMIRPFTNADYSDKSNAGFENFGIVHWIPNIITDDNGGFTLQLPATGKRNVKLLIEGMTPEGKLISEVRTITVN
ncbi:hypothetical protein HYN48_01205 [Flavobacterium magnum]|uniref:TonB-dependent receptor n=1 Tax=Flavobacterium magnum TaxID=2162713 RepID=A0A2S0RB94_9FLAO|nr:hypothetical protein [Flavobacterium magnum]AWA28815.1 hypothetical protein HYN48_01205 [Flavobacterium magnum]